MTPVIVAVAVLVLLILVAVHRHQCLLRDRARMMHDAIRHRDFSFRLPTKGLLFGERALLEALNETGNDIRKLVALSEVESWQRLTRVLTHEIMNATAPIQSICQAYLSHPGIKGSPYEEGIRAIRDTSMGLAAFVESYRKLTRLQEPVMQELGLHAFCHTLATLHPQMQWSIEIPQNLVVRADGDLLRQAFINLVRNAQEAGARRMDIRYVPAGKPGGVTAPFGKLQISNDGQSIPDEVAREIFIPFFTTKSTGTGIGLSLARQILVKQNFSLSLREHPLSGFNVSFEMEGIHN